VSVYAWPAVKLFVWALVKLTATLAVPPLIGVTCPVRLPILAVTVPAGKASAPVDPVGTITNCQLAGKSRVTVGFELKDGVP
jgi:hypothetical protein